MQTTPTERSYLIDIQEDSEGQFIVLPEEELEALDWHPGDVLEWLDNSDGSWTIRKKESE
jgi:bifunctional DNA-binding transcriptional regulator/antitoxin component of YhaV-PrlF toxin-antitoxin module